MNEYDPKEPQMSEDEIYQSILVAMRQNAGLQEIDRLDLAIDDLARKKGIDSRLATKIFDRHLQPYLDQLATEGKNTDRWVAVDMLARKESYPAFQEFLDRKEKARIDKLTPNERLAEQVKNAANLSELLNLFNDDVETKKKIENFLKNGEDKLSSLPESLQQPFLLFLEFKHVESIEDLNGLERLVTKLDNLADGYPDIILQKLQKIKNGEIVDISEPLNTRIFERVLQRTKDILGIKRAKSQIDDAWTDLSKPPKGWNPTHK